MTFISILFLVIRSSWLLLAMLVNILFNTCIAILSYHYHSIIKVRDELKKEGVWKYVTSLNILRQYDGLVFKADNDLAYISEEYTFKSHYMYKNQKRYLYDKVRLVITLKSVEAAGGITCDKSCDNKGKCATPPYSSAKYCQCKPYFQGLSND